MFAAMNLALEPIPNPEVRAGVLNGARSEPVKQSSAISGE
jgi:hypothetical protein